MRNQEWSSIFCALAIPLLLNSCGENTHELQETKKFSSIQKAVLPGEHSLSLKAGNYQLWIFYVWKSKNINSTSTPLPTIYLKSSDDLIVNNPEDRENGGSDFLAGKDPDRRGVLQSIVQIKNSGTYVLSSKGGNGKYVAAIVPTDSVGPDMGSEFRFKDDDNDNGFVP